MDFTSITAAIGTWTQSISRYPMKRLGNPDSITRRCKHSVIIAFLPKFFASMDDEIPSISIQGEVFMEETPVIATGSRRNEDIALDLMKFIAMTTGYGRTSSSGVGFQGTGAAAKPEDYAAHLLELYGKCLSAVGRK